MRAAAAAEAAAEAVVVEVEVEVGAEVVLDVAAVFDEFLAALQHHIDAQLANAHQ